jgi:hypothetical protein
MNERKGPMDCFDSFQHFSTGLALLALVTLAAVACGDSVPTEDGGPGPSPTDASSELADASAFDSPSGEPPLEGGSFADASMDAEDDGPSGADDATVLADADAARGGDMVIDANGAIDADAAADTLLDGVRNGDGGVDAGDARHADADGGCECTLDDSGRAGNLSLQCMCGRGGCLSYDVAIRECPYTPVPEDNRLDTYADCNLVVIHISNGIGIGGSTLVYDATTHEVVGAAGSGDFPASPCGTTQVFGYRAGTFPPPACPRTQSAPRCADGGDGG